MKRVILAALACASTAAALPTGELSTGNLDFGEVAVGNTADRTVVVRNVGDAVLHGSVAEACAPYSILSGGGAFALAPGDSVQVTVRFTPADTGTYGCTMRTSSCRCGDVTLSGAGIGGTPAACDVTPTSLDFGTVAPGAVVDRTFRITNTGGGLLSGGVAEECAAYTITAGGGAFTLAASEFVDVDVRFTAPGVDGSYPCTVDTGAAVLKALATCADVTCTAAVVTPSPICSVTPTTLNFGTPEPDEIVDLVFKVKNTGGGTLAGSVSEACAPYSLVAGGGDFSLAAGESVNVTVRFQSATTGSFPCTIDTGTASCADVVCSALVPTGGELAPGDFTYQGAFACTGTLLGEAAGRGLGILPNGNLLVSGNDGSGSAAIITIPTPSLDRDIGDLPVATTVQTFSDITGGIWNVITSDPVRNRWEDLVVLDDRIVFTMYDYYDRNMSNRPWVGFMGLDFSAPNGWHYVGPDPAPSPQSYWYQGKIAGQGTQIPAEYVEGGRKLALGRSRDEYGPDVSAGPSVYFVDPDDLEDAVVALCYDQAGAVGENNPGPNSRPDYSLTDAWTDMAWIGSTVLFTVNKCLYDSHYYDGPGFPGEAGDPGVCDENKGYACGLSTDTPPGYEARFELYRASDLMDVAHGVTQPHVPQPYASLVVSGDLIDADCTTSLGGGVFDAVNSRMIVAQRGVDAPNRPIFHVWAVTPAAP